MKAKNYKNVITLYDIVFKKNSITEFYFLIPFPSSVPYQEVRERVDNRKRKLLDLPKGKHQRVKGKFIIPYIVNIMSSSILLITNFSSN